MYNHYIYPNILFMNILTEMFELCLVLMYFLLIKFIVFEALKNTVNYFMLQSILKAVSLEINVSKYITDFSFTYFVTFCNCQKM